MPKFSNGDRVRTTRATRSLYGVPIPAGSEGTVGVYVPSVVRHASVRLPGVKSSDLLVREDDLELVPTTEPEPATVTVEKTIGAAEVRRGDVVLTDVVAGLVRVRRAVEPKPSDGLPTLDELEAAIRENNGAPGARFVELSPRMAAARVRALLEKIARA
jgi:hypothetical protein